MTDSLLETFFKAFDSFGHKSANGLIGIQTSSFCVFSAINDTDENIQDLEKSEWGGLLYTDNTDFLNKIEKAIKKNISKEVVIYSDLYNSTIKIIIYRQSDNELKFIYEIPSRLVLRAI
jgi:hypothetical protein